MATGVYASRVAASDDGYTHRVYAGHIEWLLIGIRFRNRREAKHATAIKVETMLTLFTISSPFGIDASACTSALPQMCNLDAKSIA